MLYTHKYYDTHLESITDENLPSFDYPSDKQRSFLFSELNGASTDFLLRKQKDYQKYQIKKWGENSRTLMQIADRHFLEKDYFRALSIYDKILVQDETNLQAYEKAIFCSLATNNFSKAKKYFLYELQVSNRRFDILYKFVLFQIGTETPTEQSLETWISDLKEVLLKNSQDYSAMNTLGMIYLQYKNEFDIAKKYFDQALEINPNYEISINNLGAYFILTKNYDKAIQFLNKAIGINTKYSSAYENLSSAYISKNEKQLALSILEQAISRGLTLSLVWQHHYGWLLLENSKLDEAINWNLNRIKSEPSNDIIYNNLGVAYKKKNDLKNARKYLTLAMNLFKENRKRTKIIDARSMNSLYNLARLSIEESDRELSKIVVNEIYLCNKNDPFGRYIEGHFQLMDNKYDLARENFESAVGTESYITRLPELYIDYSYLLECIDNEYQKAISLLEEALSKKINNLSIINNLAYAYAHIGELKKARNLIESIDFSKNVISLATMGLINLREGNLEEGNSNYSKAIKLLGKSDPELVSNANQIWLYEQSRYMWKKGKYDTARKLLEKAQSYPESYISRDIDTLMKKIKHE